LIPFPGNSLANPAFFGGSKHSVSLALHPSKQFISLQTDTALARVLLLPFLSSERKRTLFTSSEQSPYSCPRHAWLDDGSAVVLTSDDGFVRIIDLRGKVRCLLFYYHAPSVPFHFHCMLLTILLQIRSRWGAHGVAAPDDDGDDDDEGGNRFLRVRARLQSDRGSSVVRDVTVLPGTRTVVSVGYDRTIRFATPAEESYSIQNIRSH
jgi:WD40 repeat protein